MWQSHRETPLMIVKKGPKLKGQKDVVFAFPTKYFIATPHQSHPQSMINLNTMITCDWPPSHY